MASSKVLALFFALVFVANIKFSLGTVDATVFFTTRERQALLTLKQGLTDSKNRLSSWAGENCCMWNGVRCDNKTGHVLELDLRNPKYSYYTTNDDYETNVMAQLGNEINCSLLKLKHLKSLDLSLNDFNGTRIPEFIGSLQTLRYLNLAKASFSGKIPHQVGNLSNIQYLNLGGMLGFGMPLSGDDHLQWLSHLSQLELDLNAANLSNALHWLQVINMLPSLLELHLPRCQLPPLSYVNFTSLEILDFSSNQFNFPLPQWLFSLTSLLKLRLGSNDFQDPVPHVLQNLTTLTVLDLYSNKFNSTIPSWLYGFKSLKYLDLSSNWFHGTISAAIGG
ncbi:hypothetical protein GIB67_020423 [Kingdonia uniflora]|uniref:Leucine-rich repeat-containing N-terminal plant-type domain-containing protein n=1 Tax=Kingdonia uniflora TaxID=39325 RepID=A0A7J7N2D4_9MAGN|nr:hypothetical protein GIB67_020423 [Kingdonia uniflora]